MNEKLLKFLLTFLTLIGLVGGCITGGHHDKLETLIEDYDTINDYLEKNVASDDIDANVAKASEWLQKQRSKLSIRRSKSLIAALERFTRLSKKIQGEKMICTQLAEILIENVEALGDKSYRSDVNYKMRRIDRIVDKVFEYYVDVCGPNYVIMKTFSFQQNLFDKINLLLIEKEPTNNDPEFNMAKVDELLVAMGGESPLKEALRLLSSLGKVWKKKQCDQEGFEVVMKNLLATRQEVYSRVVRKPVTVMRRIDRLVNHYAYSYPDLCLNSFPEQFTPLIGYLPHDSLHSLRVFLSELLLGHTETTQAAESQFQTDFTTPELVGRVLSRPGTTYPLKIKTFANAKELQQYLRVVAANDPDVRYLDSYVDEVRGEICVNMGKIEMLYKKYLISPCKDYLKIFDQLFERFEYHVLQSDGYKRAELTPDQVGLTYGYGAYNDCEALIRIRLDKVSDLVRLAASGKKVRYVN